MKIINLNSRSVTIELESNTSYYNEEEYEIFLNDNLIEKYEVTIQKGDIISFCNYNIIFYESIIEVDGKVDDCQYKMTKCIGEKYKFEGFPYYKRSPRVIYTIEDEKIEIKAPPQKKSISKDGIMQMIVPTLSTLAFTIVMGVVMKRGAYVYMSAGMTVITLVFSIKKFISQRNENKEQNGEREHLYQDYLLEMRKEIRQKRKDERIATEYRVPTVKKIEHMILNYSSRLY